MLFPINVVYQFVLETEGDSAALDYINFILKNQDDFMESKWRNFKITDFEMILAQSTANLLVLVFIFRN